VVGVIRAAIFDTISLFSAGHSTLGVYGRSLGFSARAALIVKGSNGSASDLQRLTGNGGSPPFLDILDCPKSAVIHVPVRQQAHSP
jgi:hypothetical protein